MKYDARLFFSCFRCADFPALGTGWKACATENLFLGMSGRKIMREAGLRQQ